MSQLALPAGVEIKTEIKPGHERILTVDELNVIAQLDRAFEPRRQEL